MSSRRWRLVTIHIPPPLQELLVGQLVRLGFSGFVQEHASLQCYIEYSRWDAHFKQSLGHVLKGFHKEFPAAPIGYRLELVRDQNWNKKWEDTVGIVRATDRIVIKPSWKHLTRKDRGKIVLHIDPKMSFGTGHHETTRLSLALLERHIKPMSRVLDFGTGTGVLAVASLKLGSKSVVAIDNDEWSVLNAQENLRRNRALNAIIVRRGSVGAIGKAKFDLIVANIDFKTIVQVLKALVLSVRQGGILILSGLLTTDILPLVPLLKGKRLIPVEIVEEGEWVAMALFKS